MNERNRKWILSVRAARHHTLEQAEANSSQRRITCKLKFNKQPMDCDAQLAGQLYKKDNQ